MSFVIKDANLPAILTAEPMTDEEFDEFCAEHPDLNFEMSAEREPIVMAPTNFASGLSNSKGEHSLIGGPKKMVAAIEPVRPQALFSRAVRGVHQMHPGLSRAVFERSLPGSAEVSCTCARTLWLRSSPMVIVSGPFAPRCASTWKTAHNCAG